MNKENKKQHSGKERKNAQEQNGQSKRKRMAGILYLAMVLLSGIIAAMLAAKINGMAFGWYTWPLVVCVDLFIFSTTGFFLTEGRKEVIYGACSIVSVGCAMVQLAIIF